MTIKNGKSKFQQQQQSQTYNGGYNLSNQTMLLLSDPKFMSPSSLPNDGSSSFHIDDDIQQTAKHLSSLSNISIIKRPSSNDNDISDKNIINIKIIC